MKPLYAQVRDQIESDTFNATRRHVWNPRWGQGWDLEGNLQDTAGFSDYYWFQLLVQIGIDL